MCIITSLALGTSIGAGISIASAIAADVAIVATAVGGAVSAVQGYQQAEAAEASARYMAQQERDNAATLRKQAELTDLQGDQERAQLRLKMLQQKGKANASYAASGVVLGSGSAADYHADIADAYDLDRKNLDFDIASRRWQLDSAAVNAKNQANWYDAQAESYADSKNVSLFAGMFGTVANTAAVGLNGYTRGVKNSLSSTQPAEDYTPDPNLSLANIQMGVI